MTRNSVVIYKGLAEIISSCQVCYTFDAGPNACLFVPGAVANEMLSLLLRTFPPSSPPNADNFIRGMKPQTLSLSKVWLGLVMNVVLEFSAPCVYSQ